MNIGIDGHFVTRLPRRGIGIYSLNLIRHLVAEYPQHEFFIYIRHSDEERILPLLKNVHIRQLSAFTDPFWEQVMLPLAIKRDNVDILHSLGNTAPLFVSNKIKKILTLHDVMFLQNSDLFPTPKTWYQRMGRLYRILISPRSAKNSDAIITVSNFSKLDIAKLIPGLLLPKIHAIHSAGDPIFADLNTKLNSSREINTIEKSKSPFILCLGADDPRKNTYRTILAYLKLIEDKQIAEHLIVVGYKNWQSSNSYRLVVKANAIDRVHFLPYIQVDDLISLYINAQFFLYPSLYEGFGFPLLEAFSSGCPVIASSTTSIPEVGGDAPIYIDPLNVEELTSAMKKLINNPELRATLVARGLNRSSDFSWEATAMNTMNVYKACLEFKN